MTKHAMVELGFKVILSVGWIVGPIGCGGPPDVPHAVYSLDDNSCRSCHANPSSGAPQSPHPGRTNCVGCHHVTDNQVGKQDAGIDANGVPTIPHAITSTDDTYCLNCHKDGTNGATKTSHPDRAGCTTCHIQ
jgi:hypothetical protein